MLFYVEEGVGDAQTSAEPQIFVAFPIFVHPANTKLSQASWLVIAVSAHSIIKVTKDKQWLI